MRFANHSSSANCEALIKIVSGEARIGVFAREDIAPYTEITYDYRYGTNDEDKFVPL